MCTDMGLDTTAPTASAPFGQDTLVLIIILGPLMKRQVSFTMGRSVFCYGPKWLWLGDEMSFHEGLKCLDGGRNVLINKEVFVKHEKAPTAPRFQRVFTISFMPMFRKTAVFGHFGKFRPFPVAVKRHIYRPRPFI